MGPSLLNNVLICVNSDPMIEKKVGNDLCSKFLHDMSSDLRGVLCPFNSKKIVRQT